jgi:hypothetical protein
MSTASILACTLRWAAVVAFVMCTSPATAAPDRADELHEEGLALAAKNQFAEAREKLLEAFRLKAAYDIAGNLGAVELAGGRPREAAEHLAYSLRVFPSTASPEARTAAEERLAEAKKQVATVHVLVNVDGAEISVDGEEIGEAPLAHEIYLDPGEHRFRATRKGYKPAEHTERFDAGGSAKVSLDLVAAPTPKNGHPPGGDDEGIAPYWPIVGTGIGLTVVGAAITVGLVVATNGKASDVDTLQADAMAQNPPGCATRSATCDALDDAIGEWDSLERAAVGAGIATGSVALVTALYALLGRVIGADTTAATVRFAPTTDLRHQAGASLSIDF